MANSGEIRIFDETFNLLEKRMSRASQIQSVIAHNIANANTPGYKPLVFDDVLNKAVEKKDAQAVNLEEEMANLAKNSTEYSAYMKFLSAKLNVLKTVATQGRR